MKLYSPPTIYFLYHKCVCELLNSWKIPRQQTNKQLHNDEVFGTFDIFVDLWVFSARSTRLAVAMYWVHIFLFSNCMNFLELHTPDYCLTLFEFPLFVVCYCICGKSVLNHCHCSNLDFWIDVWWWKWILYFVLFALFPSFFFVRSLFHCLFCLAFQKFIAVDRYYI